LDRVVVHDPEGSESHVGRIEVVGEGKGEAGLEPSVVDAASFFGGTFRDSGI
jgi:hypothetical protein